MQGVSGLPLKVTLAGQVTVVVDAALAIANDAEPVLLVRLNEAALDVEVTREARGGLRFPHVHGSIPLTAVISVQALDAGG